MPTQLSVYNGALRELCLRPMRSLAEPRLSRRALDAAWERRQECLRSGRWKFAVREGDLTYTPSLIAECGFSCAIRKPAGWFSTVELSTDDGPLLCNDEPEYIYCHAREIHAIWMTDDVPVEEWTPRFTEYAECWLALMSGIATRIDLKTRAEHLLNAAKAAEALPDKPPRQPAQTARRADGGSSLRLIG